MNIKELAELQATAGAVRSLAVEQAYEAEQKSICEAREVRQEAIADANRWYDETLRKA